MGNSWRNKWGFSVPSSTVCKFWTVFCQTRRFAVRLKVGKSLRFRRTCRSSSVRNLKATALVRGGKVCPYKVGDIYKPDFKKSRRFLIPNVLTARGEFDPFYSPVADGGLAWEKTGKSCAVVGSSPRLNGRGFGIDIDAHDLVIRFNTAHVEGREVDTGSRTDVRLVGGGRRIFYEDCDEIVLGIRTGLKARMADDVSKLLPMEPIFSLHRHLSACGKGSKFMSKWKGSSHRFSSGHIGTCVALQLCEHVDLYGFGIPNKKGEFEGTYHMLSQYDNCPGNCSPNSIHPWYAEYRARRRFAAQFKLCLPDMN